MELKTYIVDKSILGMYVSPKHEVKTPKGYVTYRLIEGDTELELKKQGDRKVTLKRIYLGQRLHSTDDPTEQKFLESKPWFGTKMKIYDPLAENKKKAELVKRDAELLVKIANIQEKVELAKYGYALFGKSALEKSAAEDHEGLRLELVAYAQENPEKVIELMDDTNKSNADLLFAGLAFAKGIIFESDSGKSVSWSDNNSKIISVVVGQRPIDAVVEFFGTTEGKEAKQLIGQQIDELVKNTVTEDEGDK